MNKTYPYAEYDNNDNLTYFECSTNYWDKQEFNKNGNQIYYENSNGYIDIGTWNNGIIIKIN